MRENGFRALGGLTQRLATGIAEKRNKGRGASVGQLKAEWTAIVGAELARVTQPDALLAARQAGRTLRLRVESAMALEIQHRSGQIVERVNAYYGHRLVEDIRLVQGAVAHRAPSPARPPPDAETLRRFESRTADVEDPALRAVLARLGARIAASRRGMMLGAVGALLGAAPRPSRAQGIDKLLGVLPSDHVLGEPDAPNLIIDYFSLTCPHCANFHAAVFPVLRREWIDTGRLRFVYRHFPSDAVATRGSLLAECGGERFFEIIDVLFKAQVDWMTAPQPEDELLKVAERAGLAGQACLANDRLFDKVVDDVQSGRTLGVTYTPTLFINEYKYGNPDGGAQGIDAILRQVGR